MTKWKAAFWMLLLAVAAVIVLLISLLLMPSNAEKPMLPEAQGKTAFHVNASKAELNQLVSFYLKEQVDEVPVEYDVYIGNQVELYGAFQVFGTDVDYYMTFEPEALEDGNIVLHQQGLRVGLLDIPASYVLKTAAKAYQFPDWVHIVPAEERIYVSIADMRLNNGMRVRAESFNLKENDIQFAVLLPESAQ